MSDDEQQKRIERYEAALDAIWELTLKYGDGVLLQIGGLVRDAFGGVELERRIRARQAEEDKGDSG